MKKITALLLLLTLFNTSSACKLVGSYSPGPDSNVKTYKCDSGNYYEFIEYFDENGARFAWDLIDYSTGELGESSDIPLFDGLAIIKPLQYHKTYGNYRFYNEIVIGKSGDRQR